MRAAMAASSTGKMSSMRSSKLRRIQSALPAQTSQAPPARKAARRACSRKRPTMLRMVKRSSSRVSVLRAITSTRAPASAASRSAPKMSASSRWFIFRITWPPGRASPRMRSTMASRPSTP